MDMETELEAGTYNFSTATGSAYELIVNDAGATLQRNPEMLPVHPSMDGAELSPLRRDTEAITIIKVVRLVVNEPATFLLDLRRDGIATLRTTSEVTTLDVVRRGRIITCWFPWRIHLPRSFTPAKVQAVQIVWWFLSLRCLPLQQERKVPCHSLEDK